MTEAAQQISLDDISPDPNQPRKEFEPTALKELQDSIRTLGLLEPIMVRPKKAAGQVVPGKFTLIFGERRVRAVSGIEGMDTITAIVRDADDAESLTIQIAENDRREGLRALERSAAHQSMRKRGLTIEQIAEQTSTKPATVRDSLKLQDLIPAVRKAWGLGELDYSQALEIAKVPGALQGDVLKDALEENSDGETMSVRQLKQHIHDHYRLDLSKAPFDIKDAQLVPAIGACGTCPDRTGAQPDLFTEVKGDFCLLRPCHAKKCDAHLVKAEKAGRKVLSAGEAKEVFEYGSERPGYSSDYVLATEKPYGAKKTLGQQVDKSELVLAKTPAGHVVELVKRADLPKPKKAEKVEKSDDAVKAEREHAVRAETMRTVRVALLEEVAQCSAPLKDDVKWMRPMLSAMVNTARGQAVTDFAARRGLPKDHDERNAAITKEIDTAPPLRLRELLFDMAFSEKWHAPRYDDSYNEDVVEACKLLDVDLKKTERTSKAELEQQWKAKDHEAAAKAKRLAGEPAWRKEMGAVVGKLQDTIEAELITWKPKGKGFAGAGKSGTKYVVADGIWNASAPLEGGSCSTTKDGKERCEKVERVRFAAKKGRAA